MTTTVVHVVDGGSVEVFNTAKGLEVRVHPKKAITPILFFTFWVIAWAVTEVVVLGTLMRLEQPLQLFWLLLLALWTYGGFLALRMLLWLLTGEERIVVEGAGLSFQRRVAGLGRWRRFRAEEIRSLIVARSRDPWRWRGISDRILLASRGSRLTFGRGLDEREARNVVDLVREEMLGLRK